MGKPTNAYTDKAPIFAISRHRLLTDGKGVTTLVTFYDCPLQCRHCINFICHEKNNRKYYSASELCRIVAIDDIYFLTTKGGITFGGGEPLLHSDFIGEFKSLCPSHWAINIETSLNVAIENIKKLINITDQWIIDIKDFNNDIYHKYTQKDNYRVIENLKFLVNENCSDKILVRVPLIPGYNTISDAENTVDNLNQLGITNFEKLTYITDVAAFHSQKKEKRNKSDKMNTGKAICEVLKRIRLHVAKVKNIEYSPFECPHKTCATGSCPKCDSELEYITHEYNKLNFAPQYYDTK